MPWLAKEKRRLSGATSSAALRADAAQSALCAYLSLIALAGLAINAIWHVKWGRPSRGFSCSTAHRLGGSGSHVWEGLRLLLNTLPAPFTNHRFNLFSAVVVLWRFRTSAADGDAERRAARVAAALLFALAAYVVVTSVTTLLGYSEPKPTLLGISSSTALSPPKASSAGHRARHAAKREIAASTLIHAIVIA